MNVENRPIFGEDMYTEKVRRFFETQCTYNKHSIITLLVTIS